jgi:hypothetical protein
LLMIGEMSARILRLESDLASIRSNIINAITLLVAGICLGMILSRVSRRGGPDARAI